MQMVISVCKRLDYKAKVTKFHWCEQRSNWKGVVTDRKSVV